MLPSIENLTIALSEFLGAHPYSVVSTVGPDDAKVPAVVMPWGDNSIAFICPEKYEDLSATLNSVYLPEQLTAIWHRETKDLEVIYTAYPLPNIGKDWENRSFDFNFLGVTHKCRFGPASEKLMTMAGCFRPVGPTSTSYRNLVPFYQYVMSKAESKDSGKARRPKLIDPICFWISNIDWDEVNKIELIRNLNFYMTYFDHSSPFVIIHNKNEVEGEERPLLRYRHGSFPTHIGARRIDKNLLDFWDASFRGESARRFLYLYRIIEYSSFSYFEYQFKRDIRKLVCSPGAASDAGKITEKLANLLQELKADDFSKMVGVIKDTVDMDLYQPALISTDAPSRASRWT